LFASLIRNDDESATASLTFYDEYLVVMGLAAAKRRHPVPLGADLYGLLNGHRWIVGIYPAERNRRRPGPHCTNCHKKTDAALSIWLRGGVSHGRKNT